MNDTADLIRKYLECLNEGPGGLDRARAFLADDLDYVDPMMTVRDADDLIEQIRRMDGGATVEIHDVLGEGDVGRRSRSSGRRMGP